MAKAKKTTKKRVLKKSETVRERANKASEPHKPRRIKRARSAAAKPFSLLGQAIKRAFRPLRFMLRPFKNRPMRFVGRTLARILLLKYFRESWKELRQVEWPNRKQTWQLTLAVFIFAIFFGAIIAAADFGLDKLFKALIVK